jgi:hypothetical protein
MEPAHVSIYLKALSLNLASVPYIQKWQEESTSLC